MKNGWLDCGFGSMPEKTSRNAIKVGGTLDVVHNAIEQVEFGYARIGNGSQCQLNTFSSNENFYGARVAGELDMRYATFNKKGILSSLNVGRTLSVACTNYHGVEVDRIGFDYIYADETNWNETWNYFYTTFIGARRGDKGTFHEKLGYFLTRLGESELVD